MCEIVSLATQDWIDTHLKGPKSCTANCGCYYYCEPLAKHFRLEVTRWTLDRFELLVKFEQLSTSNIF